MAWLYPDRMHVRRLAKHLSDLKLYKAVLKTGDRKGPAQALLEQLPGPHPARDSRPVVGVFSPVRLHAPSLTPLSVGGPILCEVLPRIDLDQCALPIIP